MLKLPIIDSHLHLWDPNKLRYPWLDNISMLNRPFLLEDYNDATNSLVVEKMVFVQCECIFSQCEDEAAWITELSKHDPRIQGIVPLAPLEESHVIDVLERYSANSLIKGIRRIIQFEPDPDFCLRQNFIHGVQLLSKFNYTFDICINHTQLPQAISLVSRCPNVQFILDHIGKPNIKEQQFEPWKEQVWLLSTFPNVSCKVSGLVTEADHSAWTSEDLKPYLNHILDCFGIDRLIFGGDWPVVIQAAKYEQWVNVLHDIFSTLSHADRHKLFNANAKKLYKL